MDYITVTAKTVQDAILEASLQLETFRDNIEYEVVEEGSSGFFGIGGKKAVIKARKKMAVEDVLKEEPKESGSYKRQERKDFKKEKRESRGDFRKEKSEPREKREYRDTPRQKKYTETPDVRETREKDERQDAGVDTRDLEMPARAEEREHTAEMRVERKVVALTPEEQEVAISKAEKFLNDVFASIEMEVTVKAEYADEMVNVELVGEDMGVLIGKRGQTLDSLQYLTSLVVNKERQGYVRVKVDTENYRSRRKETLENLAHNIAFKVKRTRRPVFLEPMNPYERRIIHSALQNDPYVTTHSEGEEPYRKVVVTLKRSPR